MNSLWSGYERVAFVLSLLVLTTISQAQEMDAGLDPLEVRPTLTAPQLSLPSKLTAVPVASPGEFFVPPNVADIPDDKYGDLVRQGRNIFVNTQVYAKRYVGNGLNCVNCHLQEGRKPHSSPLWAAYGMYPAIRNKVRTVVTFENRVQDCFRFSMNGIAPTIDAPEMSAIVAYAHWLSRGVPLGVNLPGRGYPSVKQNEDPSSQRGEIIYQTRCALCHGADGLGQKHRNGVGYLFPPLWGDDSYNKGAGMHSVRQAAGFIKANMPLGVGFTLTDQEALDVASYMWIQNRPMDPRLGVVMSFLFPKTMN